MPFVTRHLKHPEKKKRVSTKKKGGSRAIIITLKKKVKETAENQQNHGFCFKKLHKIAL